MAVKNLPYRQGSASARALAEALSGRVLRLEGSRYRHNPRDLLINWGRSDDHPLLPHCLNGRGVRLASNKLEFFRHVSRVDAGLVPEFWQDRDSIPDSAFECGVVCRTVLAGHSGEGIVIANERGNLVDARLYTKYIPKTDEYRIHVGRGDGRQPYVISQQRKARRHDHENPDWAVRNLQNGFIYARADVRPPQSVLDVALACLDCLDLDFGAVDVIYHERHGTYALEVNTAPGLSGSTITDYVNHFRNV